MNFFATIGVLWVGGVPLELWDVEGAIAKLLYTQIRGKCVEIRRKRYYERKANEVKTGRKMEIGWVCES